VPTAAESTTSVRWGARSGNQVLYDRIDRGRERSQPEWRFGPISGMIETAENLAAKYGITREEADAYAARSHQRAAAAWDAGRFADAGSDSNRHQFRFVGRCGRNESRQ